MASTREDLEADLVRTRKDVENAELELAILKKRRSAQMVALYFHESAPSARHVAGLAGVTNPTVLRAAAEAAR